MCRKAAVSTEFFFRREPLRDKTPRMRSLVASLRGRFWRRGLLAACGVILCVGGSGCVVVKPYQRELLSERCMAAGFGDVLELQFRGHWEGSRHGSEGGFTTAGGGCGCN